MVGLGWLVADETATMDETATGDLRLLFEEENEAIVLQTVKDRNKKLKSYKKRC